MGIINVIHWAQLVQI